jgi:cysteinyl-tRNA synthetase
MITINGKKMGKSYNNVITLTQLFSGNNPILAQAYHPMVIRFFILQTHYRSTLDFSNEALQASEKGLKRLWEAYENLKKLSVVDRQSSNLNSELDAKINKLVTEFDDFMNDDFSTAKVLANMFELVPVINGIKDKHVAANALSTETIQLLQQKMKLYIEDILGLQMHIAGDDNKLEGIINLLINMRKDARAKKDYATSDRIRNELHALGIQLKDEKDGNISYTI